MGKLSIIKEFWEFLRVNKRWWLAPMVIILVLAGAIIVLGQNSAATPFIYALF